MKGPNKCLQSARSALFWRDRFAEFERDSKKNWVNKVDANKIKHFETVMELDSSF